MLTAIWSLGIPFCWGNLYGKYGYLQVHRYMSAGALPSESQSHLWENTISRVLDYSTDIIHELIISKETYRAVSIHWE